MPSEFALQGKRILLIEDSPVVGPYTAEILAELGCEVLGPAPNMAAARSHAQHDELDAAIVDVWIRGERAFGICEILAQRGIPFLLTSGYADRQVPEKWRDRPQLAKPYKYDEVGAALARLLGQ